MNAVFQSGDKATWLHYHRFRNSSRCYRATVRILDIRKHTARIETQRYDGTIKRRFVKLTQLYPGVRRQPQHTVPALTYSQPSRRLHP